MKPHQQLTIFPNRRRAGELRAFRALVDDYFARSERDEDGFPMDWDGAQAARSRIHQMLPRVIQVVRAAGLEGAGAGHLTTDPGPALGHVEVLQRIFRIPVADGSEQEIFDVLDMALGVYDSDRLAAMVRTVNPFHYIGSALAVVARLPRRMAAALGFRRGPSARALSAELARLEAAVARLANVEDVIEARFAGLQDRQASRLAEQVRQVSDLAERVDFAERMLAQGGAERLPPASRKDPLTPV